ncbi:hypothetical protein DPMN_191547 [Dreissena polymorpha]|uniref:Uncharacterized protein n=1 Tax=Dreissena polymorpha TaxID=45954 RepID=A0A9D4BEJ3_DREPO|nr:hypothetical protein DPMN_191547 [Dreissena polymorpha]
MKLNHQLKKNSIGFKGDSDSQYIILNQEIKQKNHLGGASSTNLMSEKRICATCECVCPVKILKLFVEKQSPNATMLFNQFDNNAILHTESSKGSHVSQCMKNISTSAKLSQSYTGHCLRATEIRAMNVLAMKLVTSCS